MTICLLSDLPHTLNTPPCLPAAPRAGSDIDQLYSQLRVFFPQVFCAKPRSSRNSSIEAFVVCKGYTPPPGFRPESLRALLAGAAEQHQQQQSQQVGGGVRQGWWQQQEE